ncbi:MAG TPA: hypothetical protein VJ728_03455, partial [Candidatus Binataceae bacterium]|nr:hypothetical protein [Candidatus Binataceae bacterium]
MKKHHMRTSVAGVGSFVSIPSAFAGADEGIKNVVKVAFTTASSQHSVEKIKPLVSTDVALLDFGAVVPESIDPDKISRDCDLVKEALTKHP